MHDILSIIYMDLALTHDSGTSVLRRCLAQHHAFPFMLLIAVVVTLLLLVATLVSYCRADLLHIQGLQLGVVLVQPPLSLAQVMVEMLPSIPEHTSNPCLQEHLIRAALHCMTTVDKQPADNGARILHSAVTAMISMLPLWSSPESPPEDLGYSDIGLPPLEPRSMQARALAMVMPVVELQQPRQRDPALEGCVEWFVNTTQLCMAVGNDPLCPDDRELVCKAYMAPYLKLIGEISLLCLLSMFANKHQPWLLTCTAQPKQLPCTGTRLTTTIMLSGS